MKHLLTFNLKNMAILCKACNMLTEPMGLYCEFCGKSPFIKDKEEFDLYYKKAKENNNEKQLQQLEELKARY